MFSVGELSLASFIGFGLGFAVAMSVFADFATENAALLYANGFSLPVHRG